MTDVERCCANCAWWDRSSEEWKHKRWRDYLYREVIQDFEGDEVNRRQAERERGEPMGRSLLQASCLGLGWGKWGCCVRDFDRGKAILCWDEKRGHNAPLHKHLVTAHDFCCSEWGLKSEREQAEGLGAKERET